MQEQMHHTLYGNPDTDLPCNGEHNPIGDPDDSAFDSEDDEFDGDEDSFVDNDQEEAGIADFDNNSSYLGFFEPPTAVEPFVLALVSKWDSKLPAYPTLQRGQSAPSPIPDDLAITDASQPY